MGEVYRATDLTLAQPVALKFLPENAVVNERVLERFQNEVRIARQVSHANVCRVYDIGEAEGLPFISMEYVDGKISDRCSSGSVDCPEIRRSRARVSSVQVLQLRTNEASFTAI